MKLRVGLAVVGLVSFSLTALQCEEEVVAVSKGEGCSLASDCAAPLVCAFEKCHTECDPDKGNRDCGDGERCVISDARQGVCIPDGEADPCTRNSDCPDPLICAVDGSCRNECLADKDCPDGSVCADSTCALETEVDENGELPDPDPEDGEGAPCSFTSQCDEGLICRFDRCQKECLSDVDCAEREACNLETFRCERSGGFCGDGLLDEGEECDDGNDESLDSCSNTCVVSFCGDGVVQAGMGEFCDDANSVIDDGCSNTCELARCGDGILHPGESCDDGNFENNDACPNNCELDVCPGNTVECVGSCVNLEENPNHCGACENPCGSDQSCSAGECVCAAGLTDCPEGCLDTTEDDENCGGCGAVCASDRSCEASVCTCDAPLSDCGGACVDPTTDEQNCGACGNVCQPDAPFCANSTCVSVDPICFQPYVELTDVRRNRVLQDGEAFVTCDFEPNEMGFAGPGLYRMNGAAGTQMPEAPPPEFSCGTHAPGWLNGVHPQPEEFIVDRTVCFSWNGNTCEWSTPIRVVNCGGFYLYDLPITPACSLAYCAE